jgi:hypothetical protein
MKPTIRATPESSTRSRPEFDSRLNSYSKTALAVAAVGALGSAAEVAAQAAVHNLTAADIVSIAPFGEVGAFSFTVGQATLHFNAVIGRTSFAPDGVHVLAQHFAKLALGDGAVLFRRGFSSSGGSAEVRIVGNANLQTLPLRPAEPSSSSVNPLDGVLGVHLFNGFSNVSNNLGAFQPGNQTGYIGFRHAANNLSYNGWLRVGVTFDQSGIPTAISLLAKEGEPDVYGAWSTGEIHGGEIAASAVPEPAQVATGLGLLALGAAGVREFRRRRKEAAA